MPAVLNHQRETQFVGVVALSVEITYPIMNTQHNHEVVRLGLYSKRDSTVFVANLLKGSFQVLMRYDKLMETLLKKTAK